MNCRCMVMVVYHSGLCTRYLLLCWRHLRGSDGWRRWCWRRLKRRVDRGCTASWWTVAAFAVWRLVRWGCEWRKPATSGPPHSTSLPTRPTFSSDCTAADHGKALQSFRYRPNKNSKETCGTKNFIITCPPRSVTTNLNVLHKINKL